MLHTSCLFLLIEFCPFQTLCSLDILNISISCCVCQINHSIYHSPINLFLAPTNLFLFNILYQIISVVTISCCFCRSIYHSPCQFVPRIINLFLFDILYQIIGDPINVMLTVTLCLLFFPLFNRQECMFVK